MMDLEKAAVDVAYEFKMFREMRRRLDYSSASFGNNDSGASLPLTPGLTAKNNTPVAVPSNWSDFYNIEGLLIHLRNLMEFFYTEKQEKDNLVLAHHFTDGKPRASPSWANDVSQRLSNLLAHLTYRRTHYRSTDNHHWKDIAKKIEHIEREITDFLDSLPPGKRTWFK